MTKTKGWLLTLCTVLLCVMACGQELVDSYVFRSDFEEEDLLFSTGESDIHKSYVDDGAFYLSVKDAGQNYRVYYSVAVDTTRDFMMAASLNFVKGNEKKGYGLCFGYKDIDNGCYFYITEDGNYELYMDKKGIYMPLVKSTTDYLSKKGEPNVLLINKKGHTLYLFLNYKMLTSVPCPKLFGNNYGVYAQGILEMGCDYLYVKQKREPINLVEGFDKFGVKKKLGPAINSTKGEIMPLITADQRYLFVTRKPYNKNGEGGDDDVYYSTMGPDSNWTTLKDIGPPINNDWHNFVCGISSDNNSMIVGGKYDGMGKRLGTGFSITHRTKNGWSEPKGIEIKNYYNDDDYVEMSPSPDFKTLIFSIRRKETFGEKDLYYSTMLPDSTWSEPINIGKDVNTIGHENSPFMAADGVTLYFSSDGWPGYGGNDIFMTRRLDNTWTHWSKPKNLGPIINSKKWDAYYTTSASGKHAYVVSNRTDENHADIYEVKQPEAAKPEPTLLVKGVVYNSKTNKPERATVTYSVLGAKKSLGYTVSSDETGAFTISLPKGKKYAFAAHRNGFISEHKNTDVVDLKKFKEEHLELYITPFEKGESVIMHNLFFVADKYEILPESEAELNRLYELMKDNKKVKIEIGGHTSLNRSSVKWNTDLSFNRANAVKEYLVAKGIKENRIEVKGYGNTKAIEKIMDEAHQSKNRRVEFTILEK